MPTVHAGVRRCAWSALATVVLGGASALAAPPAAAEDQRLRAAGVVADLPVGVPAPPPVGARSWLVADAGSGDVLGARGAHVGMLPASTLKTLTALTLVDKLNPREVYTASDGDAAVDGSKVGIVPGSDYLVSDLWQAVFLESGNDAMTALAHANGGVTATLVQMRATALALGLQDTTVRNPTGLDAPGQLSSAYDLALLGRAAVADPRIVRYATTLRARFPGKATKGAKRRSSFEIQTQQHFVSSYPGALGVKNGFTTQARYTLIAAARRGGRTVVVTQMGGDRTIAADAGKLADWAFAVAGRARPVGALTLPPASRTAAGPASGPAAVPAPVPSQGAPRVGGRAAEAALVLAAGLGAALVTLRARVLLLRRRRRRPA